MRTLVRAEQQPLRDWRGQSHLIYYFIKCWKQLMRYHYLDIARALLMVGGIFYHAALIYAPSYGWRVSSDISHPIFDYMISINHMFRMPAFYIISGFFSALLLQKYGVSIFLHNRFMRLAIPMVVVGLLLNIPSNYLSTTYGAPKSISGCFMSNCWVGHLWFIQNLFYYCIIAAVMHRIPWRKLRLFTTPNALVFWGVILFATVAVVLLPLVREVLIPEFRLPLIKLPLFFKFLPHFLFGYGFFYYRNFIHIMFTKTWLLLFMALAPSLVLYLLTQAYDEKILMLFTKAYLSFMSSLVLLSVLMKLPLDSLLARRFSGASYTIYLLHQPIIVALFYPVDALGIGLWGYALITLMTLSTTFYFHEYVVRRSAIALLLLNGKYSKKPLESRSL
jgi:glucan biosynthesis protein C